jgi:hypothetical protein
MTNSRTIKLLVNGVLIFPVIFLIRWLWELVSESFRHYDSAIFVLLFSVIIFWFVLYVITRLCNSHNIGDKGWRMLTLAAEVAALASILGLGTVVGRVVLTDDLAIAKSSTAAAEQNLSKLMAEASGQCKYKFLKFRKESQALETSEFCNVITAVPGIYASGIDWREIRRYVKSFANVASINNPFKRIGEEIPVAIDELIASRGRETSKRRLIDLSEIRVRGDANLWLLCYFSAIISMAIKTARAFREWRVSHNSPKK